MDLLAAPSPTRLKKIKQYLANLPGLIGYWPMDEISGFTAFNRAAGTKGQLNGTISGAALGEPGKTGRAYSFDGGDQVSISDNDLIDYIAANKYTWFGVTKMTLNQNNKTHIFFDKGSSNTRGYRIQWEQFSGLGDNRLEFTELKTNTKFVSPVLNNNNFPFLFWVITIDGTAQTMKYWGNGVSGGTSSFSFSWANLLNDTSAPMIFSSSANRWTGLGQHFGYLAGELSQAQITRMSKLLGF